MIHQLQLLMNDPDARRLRLARVGEGDRLAVVEELSFVQTPARIFISVDLLAPFSPISAWTSPGISSNRTSLSARTPGKVLLTPSMEMTGGGTT